jgi:hypothetical protein
MGTTTGADVLSAVLKVVKRIGLDLNRLTSLTTDGAPAMTGDKKGFVSRMIEHCRSLGCTQEIKRIHCIIHQEALCAKSTKMTEVMTTAVKAVNYVLAR